MGGAGLPQQPLVYRAQQAFMSVGQLVDKGVFVLATVVLMFVCVVLFLQVIFRYVLELPLPWSEEAARYAMVWLGMFAAVITARKGLHFVFRWGTLLMPARILPWLRQAINTLRKGCTA